VDSPEPGSEISLWAELQQIELLELHIMCVLRLFQKLIFSYKKMLIVAFVVICKIEIHDCNICGIMQMVS